MIRFAIILLLASAYFSPAHALGIDFWNAFERDVLDLVNQDRAGVGLGALAGDSRLHDAARAHSIDMATNNFFDHTGSDGSNAGQRAAAAGYTPTTWGENIAAGHLSAESVVAGWLDSPGHRDNMRNGAFTDAGIGYVEGGPNADFATYWTLALAAGDSAAGETGPGGTETVAQVVTPLPFPNVTEPLNEPAFEQLQQAQLVPAPLPSAFWLFVAAIAATLLLQRRQGVNER
jgi:hypothetical protein